MRSWHFPILVVAVLLLVSAVAFTSNGTAAGPEHGLVKGKVVDQNGAGLAGVNVALDISGTVANSTVTDLDGSYQMGVLPGTYSLVVYAETVNTSVVVTAGQTLDLGSTQIYSTKNYAWIAIDITIVVGGLVLLLVAKNREQIKQRMKK